MYCPNCKEEYEDDAQVCLNCEIPLVDILPEERAAQPPSRQSPNKLTILTTSNLAELDEARALLEMAQIPYFPRGGDMPDYAGGGRGLGYIPQEGPVAIEVDAIDAQEAREVLRGMRSYNNPDEP